MLSNKDFSSLIKAGDLSLSKKHQDLNSKKEDKNGKVRYDLKQVAEWDKQIYSSSLKKTDKNTNKSSSSSPNSKHQEHKTSNFPKGYRDRAAERNASLKQETTTLTTESQELLESLNFQKSKSEILPFNESIANVKGLDFTLLAKIRQQTKAELERLERKIYQDEADNSDEDDDVSDDVIDPNHDETEEREDEYIEKDLSQITPKTKIGHQLKQFFLKQQEIHQTTNPTSNDSHHNNFIFHQEVKVSTVGLLNTLDKTGKAYILDPTKALQRQHQIQNQQQLQKITENCVLLRSVYEYNINPYSMEDLPLTVVKSRKESKFTEETVACLLEDNLFQSLLSIFDNGKIVSKSKRKPKVSFEEVSSSSVAVMAPILSVQKGFDSIYDDIDEKYDPLSSMVSAPAVVTKLVKPKKRKAENVAVVFTDDEEDGEEDDQTLAMEVIEVAPVGSSLKGLFANVRQTAVVIPRNIPSQKPAENQATQVSAQSVATTALGKKEKLSNYQEGIKAKYGATSSSTVSYVLNKAVTDGKEVIHRDVFATTLENVVTADAAFEKKNGDAFGIGDYDQYLETGGEYELGSDEEGEGNAKPAKKAKLGGEAGESSTSPVRGGGNGKRSNASTATPWNQVPSSLKAGMTPALKFARK